MMDDLIDVEEGWEKQVGISQRGRQMLLTGAAGLVARCGF